MDGGFDRATPVMVLADRAAAALAKVATITAAAAARSLRSQRAIGAEISRGTTREAAP